MTGGIDTLCILAYTNTRQIRTICHDHRTSMLWLYSESNHLCFLSQHSKQSLCQMDNRGPLPFASLSHLAFLQLGVFHHEKLCTGSCCGIPRTLSCEILSMICLLRLLLVIWGFFKKVEKNAHLLKKHTQTSIFFTKIDSHYLLGLVWTGSNEHLE